jgi:hypothetical protein
MKGGWITGLLCVAALCMLWGGCVSPAPVVQEEEEPVIQKTPEVTVIMIPLTGSILDSLDSSLEGGVQNAINQFQVYLSTHIIMEKEEMKPVTVIADGRIQIEDVYTRSRVVIKAYTPGVASELREGREETILVVNMDTDENNKLFFSNRTQEGSGDAYFYLQHISAGASVSGDEKGSIKYGDEIYTIKYVGTKRPYLLVKTDQTLSDSSESRSAAGRLLE